MVIKCIMGKNSWNYGNDWFKGIIEQLCWDWKVNCFKSSPNVERSSFIVCNDKLHLSLSQLSSEIGIHQHQLFELFLKPWRAHSVVHILLSSCAAQDNAKISFAVPSTRTWWRLRSVSHITRWLYTFFFCKLISLSLVCSLFGIFPPRARPQHKKKKLQLYLLMMAFFFLGPGVAV